jgi:hypothetical protein
MQDDLFEQVPASMPDRAVSDDTAVPKPDGVLQIIYFNLAQQVLDEGCRTAFQVLLHFPIHLDFLLQENQLHLL